jgi:ATP/maltotriose-dependent transcriptional regulator MalT
MDEERLYAQIHEALGHAAAGPDFEARVLRSIRKAAEAEVRAIRAMEMRRSGSVVLSAGNSVSTFRPVEVVVGGAVKPPYGAGHVRLTTREKEVLGLIARGMSNAEIANWLVVSRRTVDAHLRSIYAKLEVRSRSSAVRWAIQNRLA